MPALSSQFSCRSSIVWPVAAQTLDSKLLSSLAWREIGPLPWRPYARAGRRSTAAQRLLRGASEWRRVENHRLRSHLESHLRQRRYRFGWRDRHCALRSEHHLCRKRRGLQRPDLSTGDGIYKSTDAGRTWTHLGLRDGQQIPRIAVDPRDPNKLFVAVLGHPYGPNEERGLFRSTDGGQTFEKVLYKDENTGANDVEIDPANPDIIYTSFWEARQGPWENAQWGGTNGGIFKSTDGGKTWRPLTNGFPTGAASVEQANIAIAPSNSSRLYAAIATGRDTALYRSDDAGENWSKITSDPRPAERIGGGDLPVPAVDPKNPGHRLQR